MANARDLKSLGLRPLRVRSPPPALLIFLHLTQPMRLGCRSPGGAGSRRALSMSLSIRITKSSVNECGSRLQLWIRLARGHWGKLQMNLTVRLAGAAMSVLELLACATGPREPLILDYTLVKFNSLPLPVPLIDPGTRDGQPTGCFIAVTRGELHLMPFEGTFEYNIAYDDTCGTHPGWSSGGGAYGRYSSTGNKRMLLYISVAGRDTTLTGTTVADTIAIQEPFARTLEFVRNR